MRPKQDGTFILSGREFKNLCKPGEGHNTCIWAVVGSEDFECTYYNRPTTLAKRWAMGATIARRNGCEEVKAMNLEVHYIETKTLVDLL